MGQAPPSDQRKKNKTEVFSVYCLQMPGSILVLASLLSLVLGQEYAAPSGAEYDAYAPPSAGYGEPSASYDYGYDQGGYVSAQEDAGLDLGKLTDLIPIFVVVFAAIILAQLIAPLLTSLLTLIVAIIPGTLSFKAPIINALLNAFNLQLCTTANPPVAFTGRSFTARDMKGVFDSDVFSPANLNMLATVVDEAVNAFSSKFQLRNIFRSREAFIFDTF